MAKKPTPQHPEADVRVTLVNDRGEHYCMRSQIIKLHGAGCITTFYIINGFEPGKTRKVSIAHNLGHYLQEYSGKFIQANQSVIFNSTYLMEYSVGAKIKLACVEEPIQVSRRCRPVVEAALGIKKKKKK